MNSLQDQIKQYNQLRKEKGLDIAQEFAGSIIRKPEISIAERAILWDKFQEELKKEQQEAQKNDQRIVRKEKQEARKNKASVYKIVSEILSKRYHAGCHTFVEFTSNEITFLEDIKHKRKLTSKQASWLRTIAEKAGVKIEKEIDIRLSFYERLDLNNEMDMPFYCQTNKKWYDMEYETCGHEGHGYEL